MCADPVQLPVAQLDRSAGKEEGGDCEKGNIINFTMGIIHNTREGEIKIKQCNMQFIHSHIPTHTKGENH